MTTRRVTRLDELAQSVPPARDLWPGIAAAIDAEKSANAAAARVPRSFGWPSRLNTVAATKGSSPSGSV